MPEGSADDAEDFTIAFEAVVALDVPSLNVAKGPLPFAARAKIEGLSGHPTNDSTMTARIVIHLQP